MISLARGLAPGVGACSLCDASLVEGEARVAAIDDDDGDNGVCVFDDGVMCCCWLLALSLLNSVLAEEAPPLEIKPMDERDGRLPLLSLL